MNIKEHVLKKDVEMANELDLCARYSLLRASRAIKKSDYQEANHWINEYIKCSQELEELMDRKLNVEREQRQLDQLVKTLQAKGVNIQIIRGIKNA
ncbi:hypothetical protein [Alkalihalobacterium alkalinitrilicum]|uniref:hypothetical protein n=1 Tax=Alkalihalobacterium alkalinitrilicum TaxID=427920 RepID=UPI00099553BA|nr:hypothetical protein [Alkalihalobacterium alkalinitrilicum]